MAADVEAGATVGELSERELLDRIFPMLPPSDQQLVGPGDDAAVLAAPDGRYVVTCDMMVHGPDFRLAWSTPFELGWKAAASNLADVAAMGARPTALVVALAVTPELPVDALTRFADGMRRACAALAPGCGVVGGDLSVSATLTIAVTAFGDLEGRRPVLRSGAAAGEVVALAGSAGRAAHGLTELFSRATDAAGEPDAEAAAALRLEQPGLLEAQLAPTPPIDAGVVAADAGATAMLDVSDGLALDAGRIADQSGVRIELSRSALQALSPDLPLEQILNGGEDHALLATFPRSVELPAVFRPIGTVVPGRGVTVDGEAVDGVRGWDPYRGWDGGAG